MSLINAINFNGSKLEKTAEAEYRFLDLAKKIIDAKVAQNTASLAVKKSYGHSIVAADTATALLIPALTALRDAELAWAAVEWAVVQHMPWQHDAVRSEYAAAFVSAAKDKSVFDALVAQGATRPYMRWAFDEIASTASTEATPEDGTIIALGRVGHYAGQCRVAVKNFGDQLAATNSASDLALHTHIYDHLGKRAEKPTLFTLDECYYSCVTDFEIYYEAYEQISRHAHTLVPGTHAESVRFFNLAFTTPTK